jgi:hypothetical protein
MSRPSLDELTRARPALPRGAPSRTRSHYQAILQLLKERGAQGLRASELYAHPELYGRSPRNRISEARRAGNLIEGKPAGSSDWWYRLIRESSGQEPTHSSDWYEREHGARPSARAAQSTIELPLFGDGGTRE